MRSGSPNSVIQIKFFAKDNYNFEDKVTNYWMKNYYKGKGPVEVYCSHLCLCRSLPKVLKCDVTKPTRLGNPFIPLPFCQIAVFKSGSLLPYFSILM